MVFDGCPGSSLVESVKNELSTRSINLKRNGLRVALL